VTNEGEWEAQREGKRRKMMASQEEVEEVEKREGESGGVAGGGKVKVQTLASAPAGSVREGRQAEVAVRLFPSHHREK
jgi:hypothetical protein